MKVINKKLVSMLCIIVIAIGVGIFLMCSKSSDKITLDEVRLKEPEKESGMFAIMLQSSEGSEDYTQSEYETFPKEGYTLNEEKSGCLDSDGKKLENVTLSFNEETGRIKVDVENTSYCYIYFDIKEPMNLLKACEDGQLNMDSCILKKEKLDKIKNLNNSANGDLLYRYVGTSTEVTNNYLCFGDESCDGVTDNNMYRIIGITEDGRLKLIKNTAAVPQTNWNKEYYEIDAKFDMGENITSSDIFTNLNSPEFLSYMIPSGWEDKIANQQWNIGDVRSMEETQPDEDERYKDVGTGDIVLEMEKQELSSASYKIGLIYLSDYYYSLDETGNIDCSNLENSLICQTSWLYIRNNGDSSTYREWTMTRWGCYSVNGAYYAWFIDGDGCAEVVPLGSLIPARPVFYLEPSLTTIIEGDGTVENPYMIN